MSNAPLTTVTVEGSLFPPDLLSRLALKPELVAGTRPEDYLLTPGKQLREVINRAWNDLSGAWVTFKKQADRLALDDHSAQITWDRWLLPLLNELGWGQVPRTPAALVVEGKEYPISHQSGPVLLHLLGWNTPLATRTPGVRGAATAAPHSLVQEVLNRTDEHLWAIVSNGRRLRIVRDNSSLTRAAYVEFDLEAMFNDEQFSDFVILWMTAHATRMNTDPQQDCWLEQWITEARTQGLRALDHLRDGFEVAIKTLGSGFLAQPSNVELRTSLQSGDLTGQDFYRQILRLVYRLVFLLVVEDREILHSPDAGREQIERYQRFYSLSRLRDLARRRRGTSHIDQWEQIKVLTELIHHDGQVDLGLPGLGSSLWDSGLTLDLKSAQLANADLLAAIRALAFTQRENALHRIDYRNLGSEELGSVYESLLELRPLIEANASRFELVALSGNERKTTGSYYTPTPLISVLLDASLDKILNDAEIAEDPEAAILNIKVIDPAAGSGHFLVAAAQRIANRLAVVRTGETNAAPDASREALRDVVSSCIFGIDINPMAVELCKVSLWLEAVERGRPLSFLDHHIVCGNGLIGATPRLLANGVPDSAFTYIEGDDKPTVTARKKTNAAQRAERRQGFLGLAWSQSILSEPITREIEEIECLPNNTTDQVAQQASRFAALVGSQDAKRAKLAADAWCAAVIAIKSPEYSPITDLIVRSAADGPGMLSSDVLNQINSLAEEHRFLHWHLAFPQVFSVDLEAGSETGWKGGFDVVLGNPPWETMSPDRREWFGQHISGVRAMSPEEQEVAIDESLQDSLVKANYDAYRRSLFAQVHFMKQSGRYTLFAKGNLGKGDFNIYRMFVESALKCARPNGYAAQVTPSGLYGGANASAIRAHLLGSCQWEVLLGCENSGHSFFPAVHAQTSFGVYSARIGGSTDSLKVCFGIASPSELPPAPDRYLDVTRDFIVEQAPESMALPDFRNSIDVGIMMKMGSSQPAFGDNSAGQPIRHFQREIDMGNDAELFTNDPAGLPVYEGRMVAQFDHRAKIYISGHGNSAKWGEAEFGNPVKEIVPQWRVLSSDIPQKLGDRTDRYRIGFCNIASASNERALVAALIPPHTICGHAIPTIAYPQGYEWAYLLWLAVANSIPMDFLTRGRVPSNNLNLSTVDGLPFPRYPIHHPIVELLAPLALRLTCTAPEMTDYWNLMSANGWCGAVPSGTVPTEAFVDPIDRLSARAEIDAIVAKKVFGLTREELSYALDQFPVLERREIKNSGVFETKTRVLTKFDALQ